MRAKLELAAAVAILIVLAIGFRTWLAEHDARIHAEAQVAADQKSFSDAGARIAELKASSDQIAAQASAAMDKISAAAASKKTPAQIVRWLPGQLPNLPAPIRSSIPTATAADPAPDATFEVPQADLVALRDTVAKCQADQVALPAAQTQLTDCQAQIKLVNAQLTAVSNERDQYKQELKGGTFWQRVRGGAKKVAIGIVIGAAITGVLLSRR
jgi:cell division protein FtsL